MKTRSAAVLVLLLTSLLAPAAAAAAPPPPPAAPVPQACTDWFAQLTKDARLLGHPPAPPKETYLGDPRYDAAHQYLQDLRRVQGDMQRGQLRAQCQEVAGYSRLYEKVADKVVFYEEALDTHCKSWVSRTKRAHGAWAKSRRAIINKLNAIDAGFQFSDASPKELLQGDTVLGEGCFLVGAGSPELGRDHRIKPLLAACVAELTEYRDEQLKCVAVCERRQSAHLCPRY